MSEIKENDLVTRVWPSGAKTMGRAVDEYNDGNLFFLSLDDYECEGGVYYRGIYGMIKPQLNPRNITHHKATKKEIEDWKNGWEKNRIIVSLS